jgi:hypothetical protein
MSVIGAFAIAGVAQAQFEGTVTMHMNTSRGGQDMLWSLKNNRGRMDMSAAGGVMYVIRQGDKTTIVMPSQKMYMEQTIPITPDAARGGKGTGKTPDVEFTGKKETVAGYECEHVIVTAEDGSKFDSCLAKGLGTFMMPTNPMARGRDDSPTGAIMRKLDGAFFPLKVQKVGSAAPELEVTKIEKKSLDDSMFSVPSDFRKLDLGAMMGKPPLE